MSSGLRLVGRTLLLARVDRMGRRCRSNLSMPFLVHAGSSNTHRRHGPCSNTILNPQNPGLELEGRGLLFAQLHVRTGWAKDTNLCMHFCVHAGPLDTQSTAVLAFCITDKDLETEESLWNLYERWQRHHDVSLDRNEKQRRFKAFMNNARYIHQFNKRNDTTFKLGLNNFADLTHEEISSTYKGRINRRKLTLGA
ncbi:Thiol protease SEN102 [Platanthera zijinensis]|uniref:Thiol protease SEN102 n=1 Tax=Platanthera zijinensis TaxID=2320716 RepID=A0AAP0B083_9ASPA